MAFIDMTGQTFGRLTAVRRGENLVLPSGAKATRWACRCECGTEKLVHASHLRRGLTRSCGCLRAELRVQLKPPRKLVVSYGQVHLRIKKRRGKASEHSCVDCGQRAREWSYDGLDPNELRRPRNGHSASAYSLNAEHYSPRCKRCHEDFDIRVRDGRRSHCEADDE